VKSHELAVFPIPASMRPDENNQFLSSGATVDEFFANMEVPWAVYDSWDLELACKLVTVGYPVDLEAKEKELKDSLFHTTGGRCDSLSSLSAMKQVINLARNIAQSSVAAGKIKDPDTPANWIKWAKGKDYKVAHLERYILQAPNESAKDNRQKWEIPGRLECEARQIGQELINEYRKNNKTIPGVDEIAKHVENELKKRDRRAPRGDYWKWQTIKKEALPGITGRKANGKK
jgi:hypothetical protein